MHMIMVMVIHRNCIPNQIIYLDRFQDHNVPSSTHQQLLLLNVHTYAPLAVCVCVCVWGGGVEVSQKNTSIVIRKL
jgi:hypothetical protein